jgi:hypothetical protein
MLALVVLLAGIILNGGGCPNIFSKCLSKEKKERIRNTAFKLINLSPGNESQVLQAFKDPKVIEVVSKNVDSALDIAQKVIDANTNSGNNTTSAAIKGAARNQGHEISTKPLLTTSKVEEAQSQSNSGAPQTPLLDLLQNALKFLKKSDDYHDSDETHSKKKKKSFTKNKDEDLNQKPSVIVDLQTSNNETSSQNAPTKRAASIKNQSPTQKAPELSSEPNMTSDTNSQSTKPSIVPPEKVKPMNLLNAITNHKFQNNEKTDSKTTDGNDTLRKKLAEIRKFIDSGTDTEEETWITD